MTFVSFAQNREDVVLFRALGDVASGFYIDVGAHDPSLDSVTRAFYERGWHGINLEPSSFWFSRLEAARPRDINLNIAASDGDGELEFDEIPGTGLSTGNADIGRRHREAGVFPVTRRRVAAASLASICEANAVTEVHFLKIDVEGTEKAVLAGMDFRKVRPWIVVVEAVDPVSHAPTQDDWEYLLLDADYEFALFDGLNRFYCDRARMSIKQRLLAPANVLDNYSVAPAPRPVPGFSPGFGINLIGNLSSRVGLGVITRGIASLLKSRGIPFSTFDVPHELGSAQPGAEFAEHMVDSVERLRHPVNLYVMPAIFFETFFRKNPGLLSDQRLHIANLWWEASRFPPHWIGMLSRFDGVLAMSDFIADVCRNSLIMTPTLCGEAPLDFPEHIRADRKDFGLPEDAVVFVASLDPNSDPERKNPLALVAAFRAAFPPSDRDVRLVIRLNNAATDFGRVTVQRLQQSAGGDERIGLFLDPLRYDQVLSLYGCADIYLSFHRGEGLGLGMLESMALGKAVIATGWSGNLSFMNHGNSALLRYRLVPVSGNYGFFRPEVIGSDARWADPVLEDAVAWMRLLRSDRRLRQVMGSRARSAAWEYRRRAGEALWLNELDDLWQTQRLLPAVIEKLSHPSSRPPPPIR